MNTKKLERLLSLLRPLLHRPFPKLRKFCSQAPWVTTEHKGDGFIFYPVVPSVSCGGNIVLVGLCRRSDIEPQERGKAD